MFPAFYFRYKNSIWKKYSEHWKGIYYWLNIYDLDINFLGYFSYSVNYLGGTFGFYLNEWMILTIGKIGTISLLVMSFYVLTAIQFNPNFAALFSYFKTDKSNDSDIETEEQKNTNEFEDILVVNTIKEDQIKKMPYQKLLIFQMKTMLNLMKVN